MQGREGISARTLAEIVGIGLGLVLAIVSAGQWRGGMDEKVVSLEHRLVEAESFMHQTQDCNFRHNEILDAVKKNREYFTDRFDQLAHLCGGPNGR